MNDKVFIFSSYIGIPDYFFSGYLFIDADFIANSGGALEYYRKNKKRIKPGFEGCYVIVQKNEINEIHIGVDYDGNKKLFYYSSNNEWAISNSYMQLVRHLRSNGVNPKVDEVSLYGLKISNSALTLQMPTKYSLSEGIELG